MRINAYLAQATDLSRRAADQAVADGRVQVNGQPATIGQQIGPSDQLTLDKRAITPSVKTLTVMLNKPTGYVVSRAGQGSQTVYDLLPPEYQQLKPVGRLDKDSSGLLLLTNDGQLANRLTHPRYAKLKTYEIELDKPLTAADAGQLQNGVALEDGPSKLQVTNHDGPACTVIISEGRNRQIRRSFDALGYTVIKLHRTQLGNHHLGDLPLGECVRL